ncbi:hypothetical protein [Couchioplanes caeruleus]|uniref:Uncharacterized protein n=2 Tax=Couchioplanes caeruleus TaxID=56438 RepID=A0A1K0G3E8_9ACTN|nr:hypothetical protein [Couchioplanes caeruleus]OJF11810.1 hypothetical protein BG844_24180 [Couchioplanes caeruleus subsp. caeruleus]ROP32431.1 hypothetical protein EDD30_5371 [Couchioplanes caeruleus]
MSTDPHGAGKAETDRFAQRHRELAIQIAEVEQKVAATEEQVAELHDHLAEERGDRKYQELADDARAHAKVAREMAARARAVAAD